jgi:hypothetical protein
MHMVRNTPFENSMLGIISGIFKKDIYENISCAPRSFKILYKESHISIAFYLMDRFNTNFNKIKKNLSFKTSLNKSEHTIDFILKETIK